MPLSLIRIRDDLNVVPGRLFIDGNWLDGHYDRFEQIHPATNEVMTTFVEAGARGVDQAVVAARRAFDEGPWPRMRAQDRKRMLQPIVEKIYAAEREIAQLQTLDNGIPFTFSRNSRVSPKSAADIFDHFLGWIDKINGETYPQFSSASDMQYMTFREPVGVVAAILPYNGPVMTFAMKIAPALVCGCTVVVKPSEYTNLAVLKLAEIVAESDLPPGVFNVVTADRDASEELVRHPGVDKITFTGSTAAGRRIASIAGDRVARVTLELGGKSPAIVLDDYDIETAARTLGESYFGYNTGQICHSLTRVIVPRDKHELMVQALSDVAGKIVLGDPFEEETTSGPLASARQRDTVERFVAKGVAEGALLATGGRRPPHIKRGFFFELTVFGNVDNRSAIAQEEIFGPVLSVIPVDDEADAIRVANDTPFGLNAAVFTNDRERAMRVARQLRSGTVGHNGPRTDFSIGFGGFKQSGIGREGGIEGLMAFMESKTIVMA